MTTHQVEPSAVAVTLLTQADCALCDHAKRVLARVGADHLLQVSEISLTTDQGRQLALRHGVLFAPGVLLDGQPFAYGRLSEKKLRRTLANRTPATPHI
jgi:hypothetical protein